MHGSRSKIPSKISLPYIYDVKFLALLGASYIHDISRLRVNMKVALLFPVSPYSQLKIYGHVRTTYCLILRLDFSLSYPEDVLLGNGV
jgi:hypothetical protein